MIADRERLEDAIRDAVDEVASHGHSIEHTVWVGVDGGVVWTGKGTRKACPVPSDIHGGVLVHTHPHDSSLSYADVSLAIDRDLLAMIAVTPSSVVRMNRPATGWVVNPMVKQVLEAAGEFPSEAHVKAAAVLLGAEYTRMTRAGAATFVAGPRGVERAWGE